MATSKKVSFRWSRDELETINGLACYFLANLGNDIEEKLAACILKRLIEKLAPKVAFPQQENKVHLKLEEAYALALASEKVDITELGDYEGAVIIATFNTINQLT